MRDGFSGGAGPRLPNSSGKKPFHGKIVAESGEGRQAGGACRRPADVGAGFLPRRPAVAPQLRSSGCHLQGIRYPFADHMTALDNIRIVLVNPIYGGNVGLACRARKGEWGNAVWDKVNNIKS